MSYCETCVVRNSAICASLDAGEVEALNTIGRRRRLAAGETLLWEGEEALLVANVIEGMLKLTSGTADGREQIVGVVYPADFIGRPFGSVAGHSVTALTDARICVFARADFDRFAQDHPALEHKLLQRTLAELDRTREWMLLLSRRTAGERVATFLRDMAMRLARGGCDGHGGAAPLDRFDLPFSRQQIADILGLTIETVSRQISGLKRAGTIGMEGRRGVIIRDQGALKAAAG